MIHKLTKIRRRSHSQSKRPFQLFQIETSLNCNLECVMCPWIEIHSHAKQLSLETFECIQPALSRANEIDLSGGGEPLTNPHLPEMVRTAKAAGCVVGFSTNGTLLTPELAETLIRLGLDWISISFDAATPATYHQIRQGSNFDTVMTNIQTLQALKSRAGSLLPRLMMVFVMMTGRQENYHELPAYIDLAHTLGARQVIAKNLDVIVKEGDSERGVFTHAGVPLPGVEAARAQAQRRAAELGIDLRLYELQPRQQVICDQRPVNNLYINWQGNVSPCITLAYAEDRFFNGQRVHVPCQVFGNVHQESLEAIWRKPDYVAFRKLYDTRLRQQQAALIQTMLGGAEETLLPPAPSGCQTCYYLYGV